MFDALHAIIGRVPWRTEDERNLAHADVQAFQDKHFEGYGTEGYYEDPADSRQEDTARGKGDQGQDLSPVGKHEQSTPPTGLPPAFSSREDGE